MLQCIRMQDTGNAPISSPTFYFTLCTCIFIVASFWRSLDKDWHSGFSLAHLLGLNLTDNGNASFSLNFTMITVSMVSVSPYYYYANSSLHNCYFAKQTIFRWEDVLLYTVVHLSVQMISTLLCGYWMKMWYRPFNSDLLIATFLADLRPFEHGSALFWPN